MLQAMVPAAAQMSGAQTHGQHGHTGPPPAT